MTTHLENLEYALRRLYQQAEQKLGHEQRADIESRIEHLEYTIDDYKAHRDTTKAARLEKLLNDGRFSGWKF